MWQDTGGTCRIVTKLWKLVIKQRYCNTTDTNTGIQDTRIQTIKGGWCHTFMFSCQGHKEKTAGEHHINSMSGILCDPYVTRTHQSGSRLQCVPVDRGTGLFHPGLYTSPHHTGWGHRGQLVVREEGTKKPSYTTVGSIKLQYNRQLTQQHKLIANILHCV